MDLQRMYKLAGMPLTEGAGRYDSSIDFENDYSAANQGLESAKKILLSKEMKDWIKASKFNMGIDVSGEIADAVEKIEGALKDLDTAYDKLSAED